MKYYAMIEGQQRGPFELEELPGAGVRPSTYIWCKGMDDWEKAEDIADVCRLFRNHLYDIMHPTLKDSPEASEKGTGYKINLRKEGDGNIINPGATPATDSNSREDKRFPQLPSVEEISENENTSVAPVSMVGYAWLVTFLCFPPTGIAAIIYAYKSRDAWKVGEAKEAHEYCRLAKMMTGISFFMGLLVYAFLFRFL